MVFGQNTARREEINSTEGIIASRLGGALIWANEIGKQQTLENKKRKQAQWTAEKRGAQAAKIKQLQPWLKASGPKTLEGKVRSAQNAWKHGFYGVEMKFLFQILRTQKRYVKNVKCQAEENSRDLLAIRAKEWRMANHISHKTMTLQQLVTDTQAAFKRAAMAVSLRDIKMMVSHVTGQGQEAFIMAPETSVTPDQQAALEAIIARRLKGEPLTRILGCREFWGLEFEVTPDTLDPRPDTETLVEAVLAWVRKKDDLASRPAACGHGDKQIRILDLGTGTGCIPIALLSELPNATAVAVDYSYAAASVARRNAQKYDEQHKMSDRLQIIQGDWMRALKPDSFDLIVSNPPYISNKVIQNLDVEVKNHDPFLSLSGGDDGLECYKKIISALKNNLNGKNRAFLEIGFDQLESVTRLVDDSNLLVCDSYRDIAGNPRVVEICRGDK